MSTYTCTGSEKSVDEIVETIKGAHGPGNDEQLCVAPDDFTATYLLGLAFNQPFRVRRAASPPIPIAAGETLQYPTRKRTTSTHDTAPSTSLHDGTNVLDGTDPFIVTVALEKDGQIMKILDVVPEPEQVDPRNPDAPVEAHLRPTNGKVRFKVTITPRAGNITPTSAMITVTSNKQVYFTEERSDSDWTRTGERIWEWDGFTTAPPAIGTADTGVADTRILRGQLSVQVVVMASTGWSQGSLELDNRASNGKFVDVRVDLAAGDIEGFAYIDIHRAQEDEGVWLTTLLGAILAAGAVDGIIGIVEAIHNAVLPHGGLTPKQKRDYGIALGVATVATSALFFTIVGAMLAATRLNDEEFDKLSGFVYAGIYEHWQRDLIIDGRPLRFHAKPVVRKSGPRVQYALTGGGIRHRGLNLGMGFIILAFVTPFDNNIQAWTGETAAHEFGHSIMLRTGSTNWSVFHKGSAVIGEGTNMGPDGFTRPLPDASNDLMIYYKDARNGAKIIGATIDVLGWVEICQIEFNAL